MSYEERLSRRAGVAMMWYTRLLRNRGMFMRSDDKVSKYRVALSGASCYGEVNATVIDFCWVSVVEI